MKSEWRRGQGLPSAIYVAGMKLPIVIIAFSPEDAFNSEVHLLTECAFAHAHAAYGSEGIDDTHEKERLIVGLFRWTGKMLADVSHRCIAVCHLAKLSQRQMAKQEECQDDSYKMFLEWTYSFHSQPFLYRNAIER